MNQVEYIHKLRWLYYLYQSSSIFFCSASDFSNENNTWNSHLSLLSFHLSGNGRPFYTKNIDEPKESKPSKTRISSTLKGLCCRSNYLTSTLNLLRKQWSSRLVYVKINNQRLQKDYLLFEDQQRTSPSSRQSWSRWKDPHQFLHK